VILRCRDTCTVRGGFRGRVQDVLGCALRNTGIGLESSFCFEIR